jgi:hypothetical protein
LRAVRNPRHHAREGYRNVWEEIEADNPALWNEFKSNDINAMIDELIGYKQEHFPEDKRRILTCGIMLNLDSVLLGPPSLRQMDV